MGIRTRIESGIRAWSRRNHERSLANARDALTVLSRARVEREEVELFLAGLADQAGGAAAVRPTVTRAVRLA